MNLLHEMMEILKLINVEKMRTFMISFLKFDPVIHSNRCTIYIWLRKK
jgi:hypothetical protein